MDIGGVGVVAVDGGADRHRAVDGGAALGGTDLAADVGGAAPEVADVDVIDGDGAVVGDVAEPVDPPPGPSARSTDVDAQALASTKTHASRYTPSGRTPPCWPIPSTVENPPLPPITGTSAQSAPPYGHPGLSLDRRAAPESPFTPAKSRDSHHFPRL
jgi:hypothetical protein